MILKYICLYKSIHEKKWVIINNKKENGLMM